MADYSSDRASAVADLAAAGMSVTFTPLTGSPVTLSAVQLPGDRKQYEALGLVQSNPITLLAGNDAGDVPTLSSTFSVGAASFTVAAVDPIAPAGDSIVCYVYGAR